AAIRFRRAWSSRHDELRRGYTVAAPPETRSGRFETEGAGEAHGRTVTRLAPAGGSRSASGPLLDGGRILRVGRIRGKSKRREGDQGRLPEAPSRSVGTSARSPAGGAPGGGATRSQPDRPSQGSGSALYPHSLPERFRARSAHRLLHPEPGRTCHRRRASHPRILSSSSRLTAPRCAGQWTIMRGDSWRRGRMWRRSSYSARSRRGITRLEAISTCSWS